LHLYANDYKFSYLPGTVIIFIQNRRFILEIYQKLAKRVINMW